MPGLRFIVANTTDHSPPCRLCGDYKIEWSSTGRGTVWLCFGCDIGND